MAAIHDACEAAHPGIAISAALRREFGRTFQAPDVWVRNGKLDISCPMNYVSNPTTYEQSLREYRQRTGEHLILAGMLTGRNLGEEIFDVAA